MIDESLSGSPEFDGLVLLTGATGFLGARVLRRLTARGVKVRCLVRNPDWRPPAAVEDQGIEVVAGTVLDRQACARAVKGATVVIHLAAAMGGAPAELVRTNAVGTRMLLESCIEAGTRRLVLAGSLAVYDTADIPGGGTVDESCPIESRPEIRDPYCYSKVIQETVSWSKRGAMELVVLRPGVIYGPGKPFLSTRVGLKYGNVLLKVGGRRQLPYVYVENCAEGFALAALREGLAGEVINLVDDEVPTPRQLISCYRKNIGRLFVLPIPKVLLGLVCRFSEGYHSWSGGQLPAVFTKVDAETLWKPIKYSNMKAKQLLGWKSTVNVESALRELAGQ